MNETEIAPVAEGQATPETTVEKTISETLTPETQTPVEKKENSVPESAFLNEKRARKEAEKKVKELEQAVANGATKAEIASDIADIAKEYDIDPNFLDKLTSTIRSKTEREIEERLSSKLAPLEEKERKENIDKVFNKHFTETMEKMPEFKDVVNADVIKSLSLLPQNGNKTFSQLIEETYGNAITGKRTIQSTIPSGGKDPAPLDYQKAVKDPAYFAEIMSNPRLKAEYNDIMLKKGF